MFGVRSGPAQGERGFILIFAIAVCLSLAIVGALVARSVQSALRTTNVDIEISKARALADGGVAIGEALVRTGSEPASRTCSVPGAGFVVLTIADEDGKVALNSDNAALHIALFTGLGVAREEAERYANLIADYRDGDSSEREGGAEADTYAAAGAAVGPRDANFETVAELDRVLNIPADVREKAKPFLSAFTSAAGVDEKVAAPALIEILKSGDTFAGAAFSGLGTLPDALSAVSTRRVYKIRAVGVTAGARFVRESVVIRPVEPGQDLRSVSWMQSELSADDDALLTNSEKSLGCYLRAGS